MLQYILDGGIMMVALVGLSVLGLAIIIDRLRVFRLAEAENRELQNRVRGHLENNKVDAALDDCQQVKGPAAAVLLVGLQQYKKMVARKKPFREIEAAVSRAMGDYAPHVLDTLEKRLNYLSNIGSVAPLLGMTGTVVGMIMSFESMAQVGGLDGGKVASGISIALITTATGLLIAIPAVIYHNIFSRKIEEHTLEIEATANTLIDFITLNHD